MYVLLTILVRVSEATIYDEERPLKSGEVVSVNEYETKTLRCVPGYSHPLPTIQWFIGNETASSSTGAFFKFNATNAFHEEWIYCIADNIPDTKDDAISDKVTFYVKGK